MSDESELASLRAEAEALREEVRLLRASQPVTWYQPSPYANACAGGQIPQTVWLNTAGPDQPVYGAARSTVAAGCGVPQVLTFTVPAGVMWTPGPYGGELVISDDGEGEYVCTRCQRDQCERCRDADCRCCGGMP